MRQVIEQTILNAITPVAITSSTDATPIVITATSHGLITGDRVLIQGHTTNIAANGIFKVTKVNANSFSIQDEFTGANIAGSGAGAGANGFCMKAPEVMLVSDFKAIDFTVITSGTATTNVTPFVSNGQLSEDQSSPRWGHPNFGATISKTNPYGSANFVDLIDGVSVPGSTGIVVAGTDIDRNYEMNTNGVKYWTAFPITWTQGAITIKARAYYK